MAKVTKAVEISDAIIRKHGSEAAGARSVGWKRQRLHKILTFQRAATVEDANVIATISGLSVAEVCDIFLRYKSPNGRQST